MRSSGRERGTSKVWGCVLGTRKSPARVRCGSRSVRTTVDAVQGNIRRTRGRTLERVRARRGSTDRASTSPARRQASLAARQHGRRTPRVTVKACPHEAKLRQSASSRWMAVEKFLRSTTRSRCRLDFCRAKSACTRSDNARRLPLSKLQPPGCLADALKCAPPRNDGSSCDTAPCWTSWILSGIRECFCEPGTSLKAARLAPESHSPPLVRCRLRSCTPSLKLRVCSAISLSACAAVLHKSSTASHVVQDARLFCARGRASRLLSGAMSPCSGSSARFQPTRDAVVERRSLDVAGGDQLARPFARPSLSLLPLTRFPQTIARIPASKSTALLVSASFLFGPGSPATD